VGSSGQTGNLVLQPAIVRPDHLGRTHPDPRADPPTEVLDLAGARTTEIREIGLDTDRIPVIDPDPDTARIPVVEADADPEADPDTDVEADPDAERVDDPAPEYGHALALSSLLGALVGLVSWLVAARLMPVAAVGDAQLAVSVFLLVGGLAQLAVGLMRKVPAGRSPGRLLWSALLLVMPLSGLAGLGYSVLTPRLAAISAVPEFAPDMGLLLFVLACAGWGLVSTHDVVLAAAGRPRWAAWRGGTFAVVQIGALVVLAGVAGLGAYGVVLSWAGPAVVLGVLGTVVIAVLTLRGGARAEGGPFLGVAKLGATLLYFQVPIVVNLRFGPETGAAFFIAWQVFIVVDLVAAYFMSSLSVSVAREPGRAPELVATARRRLLIVFLPGLALGAALADPLLGGFGAAYAEAAHVLRLLLLGLAFRLVVTHELGVRQALGRGVGFAQLQLLSTVLVLVMVIAVPVAAGGVTALLPVAVGYIVVQVACAAAMLVLPAARRTDVEVPAP
jgi:hypothetical protein